MVSFEIVRGRRFLGPPFAADALDCHRIPFSLMVPSSSFAVFFLASLLSGFSFCPVL